MRKIVEMRAGDKRSFETGFTLLEMAIVLIILGLTLASFVLPLIKQKNMSAEYETRRRISIIKEALLGYVVLNKSLPCPANPYLATTGFNNAGKIDSTYCDKVGVVPWTDLGLLETDGWGRRFTYKVDSNFVTSIALTSAADITINDGSTPISVKIPVVIVSHGENGYGAYTSEGFQFEKEKVSILESNNTNNDMSFTSMAQSPSFDDIVDWLSPNVIFNRMVAAGKLP